MGKNIFVNATAATEGGILTILNQFLDAITENNSDNHHKFFVFVSNNIKNNDKDIKVITNVKGKGKIDRLLWDLKGMKRWSMEQGVFPDLIISLQNTGVSFKDIPQIVYIHQALPFAQESHWNVFKSEERMYWTYKYLYKFWIDFTVKKKAHIVVQTEWMKEALINNSFDEKKITVSFPSVKKININDIMPSIQNTKYLFYPAAEYKYKNHEILIEAIKNINRSSDIKFKIVLTLDRNSEIYRKINDAKLNEYFIFVGSTTFDNILSLYKGCQAVLFPSYIETVGLPLIEGSTFGKKILVADCKYSREILSDYELASFINYYDVKKWEAGLLDSLNYYEEKPNQFKQKNGWKEIFKLIDTIL